MSFEMFDKRAAGRVRVPTITIQKRGTIGLNSAAAHLLVGEGAEVPEEVAVELLYDRVNQVVGVRRAKTEHANVYYLRKQQASDSYLLAGKAFTQYYGIVTGVSRRYVARDYGDGIIGVSLKDKPTREGAGEG